MANYKGKERRQEVDNSVIYRQLGVLETKMDAVLGMEEDVRSLKRSRNVLRGVYLACGTVAAAVWDKVPELRIRDFF